MLEAVVVLAIIVLIAAALLISSPRLSERTNLQRSAYALALALRRVQNMSLAVRQTGSPPQVPTYYGVFFDRTSRTYVLFGDFFPLGSPNGRYDTQAGSTDVGVERVDLDPRVSIGAMVSDPGGPAEQPQDILNVAFHVPEAEMRISNSNQQVVGQSAEIVLATASGMTRSVVVWTTGQIRVR